MPELTYIDLWDAFVWGAREVKLNPKAEEKDFQRAADAYCKLVHLEKDPEGFKQLGCKHLYEDGKSAFRVCGGFLLEDLQCDLCGQIISELDLPKRCEK